MDELLTPAPVPNLSNKSKRPGVKIPSQVSEMLERQDKNLDIHALAKLIQEEFAELKLELVDAKGYVQELIN